MNTALFGRCGMPCGLCSMHHIQGESRCAGCRQNTKSFSAGCTRFSCCSEKGHLSCGQCEKYPCDKIANMAEFKGFHTNKVWLSICEEIRQQGLENWYPQYEERCLLLEEALAQYNNGRMKNFLCKLFIERDLDELKVLMRQAAEVQSESPKESFKRFMELALLQNL